MCLTFAHRFLGIPWAILRSHIHTWYSSSNMRHREPQYHNTTSEIRVYVWLKFTPSHSHIKERIFFFVHSSDPRRWWHIAAARFELLFRTQAHIVHIITILLSLDATVESKQTARLPSPLLCPLNAHSPYINLVVFCWWSCRWTTRCRDQVPPKLKSDIRSIDNVFILRIHNTRTVKHPIYYMQIDGAAYMKVQ